MPVGIYLTCSCALLVAGVQRTPHSIGGMNDADKVTLLELLEEDSFFEVPRWLLWIYKKTEDDCVLALAALYYKYEGEFDKMNVDSRD